ncbi:MAG: hypothetical protein LUG57_04790, partial [Oscillospiraceae bacterium]|nr:hypothetical protein [Oscillospiraceae bacterium]
TVPPTSAPSSDTKAFGLTEVPAGLTYETVEALEADLVERVLQAAASEKYTAENTAVYNVLISTDGGVTWREPTEEDLENGEITIIIPYPDGTDKSYVFTALHMFTVGDKAGETETPVVTNTDSGLQMTLHGLSPVALAWTEAPAATAAATAAAATADPAATAPSTGDEAHTALWLALLAATAWGLAVIPVSARKKSK